MDRAEENRNYSWLKTLAFFLCCALILPTNILAEFIPRHGLRPEAPTPDEQKSSPHKKPFKGLAIYTKNFRELCDALYEEGRNNDFYEISRKKDIKVPSGCESLKSFLRMFVQECEPKKYLRREKEAQKLQQKKTPKSNSSKPDNEITPEEINVPPTPKFTPTPFGHKKKQREPSAAVVDSVSLLFNKIATDSKRNKEMLCAISSFREIVDTESSLSPAAKEYLLTVISYIDAAFEPVKDEATKESTYGDFELSDQKPTISVDALFE